MERYICIHCHFYQPPRENPWLEAVELQDSAYPYHDWNERITAECYAPNSASRILDDRGRIAQIVNNYSRISFNFGPTLLSWMEDNTPQVYEKIIEADRESRKLFSGHGSAIAQSYNHMILPLANRRDKETQIKWGLRDFEHRFGRAPEGMWLPETAVDVETLEVLAENGIKFTILAPHQARQVRRLRRNSPWHNVEGAKIDPTRPYVCRLPSGKAIRLFFYDGPISRAVAFEKLLSNGETFAQRLLSGFSETRKWPQLMHIATDGETYGHHHAHGDMALAYALHYIESRNLARVTNYGEYLARYAASTEVEIVPNSSWSCMHGVERWQSNCGCNSGGHADWTQEWRRPLRAALDWLRDALAAPYEEKARALLRDPWEARDQYIRVVLERNPLRVQHFLDRHAIRELSREERVLALKLLEMQRHAMLMYTSCGWFFDELTGIETVQVIFYAGRAIQLAQDIFGEASQIEQQFLERLAQARSNLPEFGDGAQVYNRLVKPAIVDLLAVCAHYAISSIFDGRPEHHSIYCYNVDVHEYRMDQSGRARLALGRADISSQITEERATVSFGVLHFGDHNLNAGVRYFQNQRDFEELAAETSGSFTRGDIPGTLRLLDKFFSGAAYSLKSLFRDEQRCILDHLLESILAEAEASYRHIYELHSPLARFLTDLHLPLPRVLSLTAEFVLNSSLRRALAEDEIDLERVRGLLSTAAREKVALDAAGLAYALKSRLDGMMEAVLAEPSELQPLVRLESMLDLARSLPFEVNLWNVQNGCYQLLQTVFPVMRAAAESPGLADDGEWARHFTALAEKAGISVEVPAEPAAVGVR
ncbi:MAG: DUF3536 domain-containing protein [Terriglobales bacterium]